MGSFDLDERGLPKLLPFKGTSPSKSPSSSRGKPEKQYQDKNGKLVNKKGWLINKDNSVIDLQKDVKFTKDQLTKEGDLPRLFNYSG